MNLKRLWNLTKGQAHVGEDVKYRNCSLKEKISHSEKIIFDSKIDRTNG
jgi:hypothetical protein